MYRSKRFRARPIGEVVEELERIASQAGSYIRRVFLADGDPMALPAERMIPILEACGKLFPRLERVTTYATPRCHHRCRD
jgi:coproporphyrinogen III oxidase-like Fe-S oxidoreductase